METTQLQSLYTLFEKKILLGLSLAINSESYNHCQVYDNPQDLANIFIKLASSRSLKRISPDSRIILLFSRTSLIANTSSYRLLRVAEVIRNSKSLSNLVKSEACSLLCFSALLRINDEEAAELNAELFSEILEIETPIIKKALSMYLLVISTWRPLSLRETEICRKSEICLRAFALRLNSHYSQFFAMPIALWMLKSARLQEYQIFKDRLLCAANQSSIVAEAILSVHERAAGISTITSLFTTDWLEWVRPGWSLSLLPSDRSLIHRTCRISGQQEVTVRLPKAFHSDKDILMNRYYSALSDYLNTTERPSKDGITFITSVYSGYEWIESFLSNITSLEGFDACELFLINAASPQVQAESSIIRKYSNNHKQIHHLVLDSDPGLYNVWNLGVLLSRCRYISNANLDDRKASDFITSHLNGFSSSRDTISLVSAPSIICSQKYIGFESYLEQSTSSSETLLYNSSRYYTYSDMFLSPINEGSKSAIIWRNIPHCMPVWRKELHEKYGYFNEFAGGPAADLEFWLRCTKHGETFCNLNEPKGLYYYSSTSTYSARKQHSLQRIKELHIDDVETANLSYLSKVHQ